MMEEVGSCTSRNWKRSTRRRREIIRTRRLLLPGHLSSTLQKKVNYSYAALRSSCSPCLLVDLNNDDLHLNLMKLSGPLHEKEN